MNKGRGRGGESCGSWGMVDYVGIGGWGVGGSALPLGWFERCS